MVKNIVQFFIYRYQNLSLISYSDTVDKKWILEGVFSAVSPMYRPIPWGMNFYSCEIYNQFPYNVKDIKFKYDLHDTIHDTRQFVNFITYSQPVPNTRPLYFYPSSEGIHISFKEKNLPQLQFSPIFVLYLDPTFSIINNRCIPRGPDLKLKGFTPLSFEECMVYLDKSEPKSLLQLVKSSRKKYPLIVSVLLASILLVSVLLVIKYKTSIKDA
jgi:hypothetical protein